MQHHSATCKLDVLQDNIALFILNWTLDFCRNHVLGYLEANQIFKLQETTNQKIIFLLKYSCTPKSMEK